MPEDGIDSSQACQRPGDGASKPQKRFEPLGQFGADTADLAQVSNGPKDNARAIGRRLPLTTEFDDSLRQSFANAGKLGQFEPFGGIWVEPVKNEALRRLYRNL